MGVVLIAVMLVLCFMVGRLQVSVNVLRGRVEDMQVEKVARTRRSYDDDEQE